jgi:hypothetical protein
MTKAWVLAAFTALAAIASAEEIPGGAALTDTVRGLDTKLFDAYNRCDLDTLSAMVSEDLEFYHDVTGLSRGRDVFLTAIKNNICGKVHRDLVAGTMEVYPLAHFGAVEIGQHVFCDPRQTPVCDPKTAGIAKFVTLWRFADGKWQITRVISFNHVNNWQR